MHDASLVFPPPQETPRSAASGRIQRNGTSFDPGLHNIPSLAKANIANEVVVVRDGVEALDYLFATGTHEDRDASELPAIVLLDIKLPKLDGLEVLRRIRGDERTKLMPVIMLTSSNEDSDRLASYVSGANSFVKKPVEFGEFAKAVADLGRYWLVINEPPPATS